MWMARTDQLGSATPQRYGLPDPPRLSALNPKSNGPDRQFDPGWFTEKQISRSISFGVSRSRDGEVEGRESLPRAAKGVALGALREEGSEDEDGLCDFDYEDHLRVLEPGEFIS